MGGKEQRRIERAAGARQRVTAIVGVSALAAVTLILVVIALIPRGTSSVAGATPTVNSAPPVTASAAPAETTAVPAAPTTVALPTRVLAASDADKAYRAATGACPSTPATIEATADAGATWTPYDASLQGTAAAVQSISPGSGAFVSAVALTSSGCSPVYLRSFVSGVSWQGAPGELDGAWFIDPANRAGVHSPSGNHPAPCPVAVQLAARDGSNAAVLCEDGTLHATTDGAGSWQAGIAIPGAAAVAVASGGYEVAVTGQNGCAGAQVVTVQNGAAAGAGACAPGTANPGEVALAVSAGGTTWLWAGSTLLRSNDGGATWS